MIHILKRLRAPAILRNRGVQTTQELNDAYESDPEAYDEGEKVFTFKGKLYGAKSVKNALIKDQHRKCCFCESKITHVAYGDVEHFRPKKGWRQQSGDSLGRPGYYWLAYDWQNLFLSCQICNQRHKGNLFPLEEDSPRAINHQDDLREERPLLVSPDAEPESHIQFFADEAVGVTEAGKVTVLVLGLNRDELELREQRIAALERLRVIKRFADNFLLSPRRTPEQDAILAEALKMLAQAQEDSAEYTSMVRALLAKD